MDETESKQCPALEKFHTGISGNLHGTASEFSLGSGERVMDAVQFERRRNLPGRCPALPQTDDFNANVIASISVATLVNWPRTNSPDVC